MKKKTSYIPAISGLTGLIFIAVLIGIYLFSSDKEKTIAPQKKAEVKALLTRIDSIFWKDEAVALLNINEAIAKASSLRDTTLLSLAIYYKGSTYQAHGNSDSAMIYFNKALALASSSQIDSLIARNMAAIGIIYWQKDDYYNAMSYLTSSLKSIEDDYLPSVKSVIYNGLGLVYVSLNDYEKAREFFTRSLAELEAIPASQRNLKYRANIGITSDNLGNCYYELKKYDEAYKYHMKALEVFKNKNLSGKAAHTYLNICFDLLGQNDRPGAYKSLKAAEEMSKTGQDKELAAKIDQIKGLMLSHERKWDSAIMLIYHSYAFYSKFGPLYEEVNSLDEMNELYRNKGDFDSAYKYFTRLTTIKDSINSHIAKRKIDALQWKYDYEKKDIEYQLLQRKIEIKSRNNSLIVLSLVSFIAMMFLLFRNLRLKNRNLRKTAELNEVERERLEEKLITDSRLRRMEENRHQQELEEKNRKLAAVSLQLVSKNEIMQNVLTTIDKHKKESNEEGSLHDNLKTIVKESSNIDKEWLQFKPLFEEVHIDFFKKLKEQASDLTESELRLCAYLKINLKTKEIAKVLSLSPETVKSSRYHIRKKLGITGKASLEDFIRGL